MHLSVTKVVCWVTDAAARLVTVCGHGHLPLNLLYLSESEVFGHISASDSGRLW